MWSVHFTNWFKSKIVHQFKYPTSKPLFLHIPCAQERIFVNGNFPSVLGCSVSLHISIDNYCSLFSPEIFVLLSDCAFFVDAFSFVWKCLMFINVSPKYISSNNCHLRFRTNRHYAFLLVLRLMHSTTFYGGLCQYCSIFTWTRVMVLSFGKCAGNKGSQ